MLSAVCFQGGRRVGYKYVPLHLPALAEGVWASMALVACVCFFPTVACGACRCKKMQEAVERDFACSCMWLRPPAPSPTRHGSRMRAAQDALRAVTNALGIGHAIIPRI
jgi:hypothetical protein